ncbi:hypothetical protein PPHE_b0648 [Pseudoalteromonas phenolica O-BC30]|nr:hypothetical protein [Pseudoalteromonas phenolica O-BC30]
MSINLFGWEVSIKQGNQNDGFFVACFVALHYLTKIIQ